MVAIDIVPDFMASSLDYQCMAGHSMRFQADLLDPSLDKPAS
jgi:hypothetical protein